MKRVALPLAIVVLASTAHADEQWAPGTIAAQTGAGVLGGLLLGSAGAILGLSTGHAGAATGLGFVGLVAGTTIGVTVAGDFTGANGESSWTLGGAIVGGVATIGVIYGARELPDGLVIPAVGLAMVVPPIIAYHLSIKDDASPERRFIAPLVLGGF